MVMMIHSLYIGDRSVVEKGHSSFFLVKFVCKYRTTRVNKAVCDIFSGQSHILSELLLVLNLRVFYEITLLEVFLLLCKIAVKRDEIFVLALLAEGGNFLSALEQLDDS